MKKLYARFWLWKNGYCKHGVAYVYTPFKIYGMKTLSCSLCDVERLLRQDAEHKKREQKKQRMLNVL